MNIRRSISPAATVESCRYGRNRGGSMRRYAAAMNLLLMILLTMTGATASLGQSKSIGAFKFEKTRGTHKALVIFQTRAFVSSKHKVTKARDLQTIVDGKLAHGTDGNIPKLEIGAIKLLFDGIEVAVPRKLYSDCFEPNLDDESLIIRFGRDFQSVIVTMSGSDGAGGYEVVWRFRKTGYHSRSFRQGF